MPQQMVAELGIIKPRPNCILIWKQLVDVAKRAMNPVARLTITVLQQRSLADVNDVLT
jgi:hypothetical protein